MFFVTPTHLGLHVLDWENPESVSLSIQGALRLLGETEVRTRAQVLVLITVFLCDPGTPRDALLQRALLTSAPGKRAPSFLSFSQVLLGIWSLISPPSSVEEVSTDRPVLITGLHSFIWQRP